MKLNASSRHFMSILGPVVQSILSLTSSLVVKMLTALVSTVSNSVIFAEKNVSSFCKCKSYSHFFTKNISLYAIFNDQSFNDTLINNIVSFEQLGPDLDLTICGSLWVSWNGKCICTYLWPSADWTCCCTNSSTSCRTPAWTYMLASIYKIIREKKRGKNNNLTANVSKYDSKGLISFPISLIVELDIRMAAKEKGGQGGGVYHVRGL